MQNIIRIEIVGRNHILSTVWNWKRSILNSQVEIRMTIKLNLYIYDKPKIADSTDYKHLLVMVQVYQMTCETIIRYELGGSQNDQAIAKREVREDPGKAIFALIQTHA